MCYEHKYAGLSVYPLYKLREMGPEAFRPAPFFRPVVRRTRPLRDYNWETFSSLKPTITKASVAKLLLSGSSLPDVRLLRRSTADRR